MAKPFDGDISRFYAERAPQEVHNAIESANKGQILNSDFPYDKRWKRADYEAAIKETLTRINSDHSPWKVVKSDDKRRARVNAIRTVLSNLDYSCKDPEALGEIDSKVAGGIVLSNG